LKVSIVVYPFTDSEPNSPDSISSSALVVPTKILGDPEELERHLMQANGYGMGASFSSDGRYDAMLPEVEIVDVELAKDAHGLGITIAGYVCEKGTPNNTVSILVPPVLGIQTCSF